MRPSTDPFSNRRAAASGLTLVELLVSILIGGFVSAGLTAMLNAEFRSSSAILRYQRSARHAAHARRFIESEAATATRLEQVDANTLELFGVHPNATTYTITYDVVPTNEVNLPNIVTFRGPLVLRRRGPAYRANGTLNPEKGDSIQRQPSVILDGLAEDTDFQVNANGSSLGAALTLSMETAGAANFFITVATSPAFGVLQLLPDDFEENCGPGCRDTGTIREWDTRQPDILPTIPAPPSTTKEVIVYFNSNFSDSTIKAAVNDPSPCLRTSCFVDPPGDKNYSITAANDQVVRLVFLDRVVAVPATAN
jgi:hypothetical protein